jgi:hypothetical protein
MAENTSTFILAKQRKIKEALALLLDVDSSQVSIQSTSSATSVDMAAVELWGNKSNTNQAGINSSNLVSGNNSIISSSMMEPLRLPRQLLQTTGPSQLGDRLQTVAGSGLEGMLDDTPDFLQQLGEAALTNTKKQQLAALAVPLPVLAANGALVNSAGELLHTRSVGLELLREPAHTNKGIQQATNNTITISSDVDEEKAMLLPETQGHQLQECKTEHPFNCAVLTGMHAGNLESTTTCRRTTVSAAAKPAGQRRNLQELPAISQQGKGKDASVAGAPVVNPMHNSDAAGVAALLAADPLSAKGAGGGMTVTANLAPLLSNGRPAFATAEVPKRAATLPADKTSPIVQHIVVGSNFRSPAGSGRTPAGGGGIAGARVHSGASHWKVAMEDGVFMMDIDTVRPGRHLIELEQEQEQPAAEAVMQTLTVDSVNNGMTAHPDAYSASSGSIKSRGISTAYLAKTVPEVPMDPTGTELDAINQDSMLKDDPLREDVSWAYHMRDHSSWNNPRADGSIPTKPKYPKSALGSSNPTAMAESHSHTIWAAAAELLLSGNLDRAREQQEYSSSQLTSISSIRRNSNSSVRLARDARQQEGGALGRRVQKTPASRRRQPTTQPFMPSSKAVAGKMATNPWDTIFKPSLSTANRAAAAAAATSSARSSMQDTSRQLLSFTGNNSNALLVVIRITGYKTSTDADMAARFLRQVVANGTLRSTLAAQGWVGLELGLQYIHVGKFSSLVKMFSSTMQVVIGLVVSGGAAIALVMIALWIRRRRRQGAAQVPGTAASIDGATPGSRWLGQLRPGQAGSTSAGTSNSPRARLLAPVSAVRPGSPGSPRYVPVAAAYAAPGGYPLIGSVQGATGVGCSQASFCPAPSAPLMEVPTAPPNSGKSAPKAPADSYLGPAGGVAAAHYSAASWTLQSSPRSATTAAAAALRHSAAAAERPQPHELNADDCLMEAIQSSAPMPAVVNQQGSNQHSSYALNSPRSRPWVVNENHQQGVASMTAHRTLALAPNISSRCPGGQGT